VGADGPASTVREQCGIVMQGPAALGHSVNIHFRADLTAALRGRSVNMAMILNPAQPGLLLNIDGAKTWTAQAIVPAGTGPEFNEERCRAVVRAQVGDPELDVEILGVAPWTSAARVAERLSSGRAFLVGDAAQEMPPAGGFGMNVGIQEADNLAWKLAAVIQGSAGPGLLETYGAERLPIARQVTQEAMLNLKSVGRVDSGDGSPPQVKFGRPEFFREHGLVFGAAYTSAAVISDGTQNPPVANEVSEYVPSATPGCRAPHLWIEVEGRPASTLDLSQSGFVLLLAGPDSEAIVPPSGVSLRTVHSADPALAEAYGLAGGGAVLIRPDGHIAWRAREVTTAGVQRALASILDRSEVGAAIP
jgi:putative polyketide hydroxylase